MKDTQNVLDFNAFMEFFTARLGECTSSSEIFMLFSDGGVRSVGAHRFFGDVNVVFEDGNALVNSSLLCADPTLLPRIRFCLPGEPPKLSRYFTTDEAGIEAAFDLIKEHWASSLKQ